MRNLLITKKTKKQKKTKQTPNKQTKRYQKLHGNSCALYVSRMHSLDFKTRN